MARIKQLINVESKTYALDQQGQAFAIGAGFLAREGLDLDLKWTDLKAPQALSVLHGVHLGEQCCLGGLSEDGQAWVYRDGSTWQRLPEPGRPEPPRPGRRRTGPV